MSLIDNIISQLSDDVKQNVEIIFSQEIKDLERDDLEFSPDILSKDMPTKRNQFTVDSELGQVNKAYEQMRKRGLQNKLADSFRTEEDKTTESPTTRGFKKTITGYARYLSILQATH